MVKGDFLLCYVLLYLSDGGQSAFLLHKRMVWVQIPEQRVKHYAVWCFVLFNNESVSDQQHNGSLFTLFLHSPLTAFCFICNMLDIPIHLWERCQSFIDRFVTEASRLFTRCRIGKSHECISSHRIPDVTHITTIKFLMRCYLLIKGSLIFWADYEKFILI